MRDAMVRQAGECQRRVEDVLDAAADGSVDRQFMNLFGLIG
jgi:hypothetical protein